MLSSKIRHQDTKHQALPPLEGTVTVKCLLQGLQHVKTFRSFKQRILPLNRKSPMGYVVMALGGSEDTQVCKCNNSRMR